MARRWVAWTLGLVVLGAAGAGVYVAFPQVRAQIEPAKALIDPLKAMVDSLLPAGAPAAAREGPPVVRVSVQPAGRTDIPVVAEGIGTVQGFKIGRAHV
jgi:hypothetical protein